MLPPVRVRLVPLASPVRHGVIQPQLPESHPLDITRSNRLSHRTRLIAVHTPSRTHPPVTTLTTGRHPQLRLLTLHLPRLVSRKLGVRGIPARLLLLSLLSLLLLQGCTLIRHPTRQAHPIRCRLIRLVHPHRSIPARIEPIPRCASRVAHPSPCTRGQERPCLASYSRSSSALWQSYLTRGRRPEGLEVRFTPSFTALRRTRPDSGGRRRGRTRSDASAPALRLSWVLALRSPRAGIRTRCGRGRSRS